MQHSNTTSVTTTVSVWCLAANTHAIQILQSQHQGSKTCLLAVQTLDRSTPGHTINQHTMLAVALLVAQTSILCMLTRLDIVVVHLSATDIHCSMVMVERCGEAATLRAIACHLQLTAAPHSKHQQFTAAVAAAASCTASLCHRCRWFSVWLSCWHAGATDSVHS